MSATEQMSMTRRKQLKPAKLNANEDDGNAASIVDRDTKPDVTTLLITTPPTTTAVNDNNNDGKIVNSNKTTTTKQLIKRGTTFGPFDIVNNNDRDTVVQRGEDGYELTVPDVQKTSHVFRMKRHEDWTFMNKLQFMRLMPHANCMLSVDDNHMRVVTTENVHGGVDALKCFYRPTVLASTNNTANSSNNNTPQPTTNGASATKQFACDRCCIASFSSRRNLDAHQTYYCRKRTEDSHGSDTGTDEHDEQQRGGGSNNSKQTSTPTPHSKIDAPIAAKRARPSPSTGRRTSLASTTSHVPPPAPVLSPSHTMLLPVAYTNADRVHLVGQPQTIVPVAVPRTSTMALPPATIQIDAPMLQSCTQLAGTIGVANGDDNTTPFKLQVVVRNGIVWPVGASPPSYPFSPQPQQQQQQQLQQHSSPTAQSDTSSGGSQQLIIVDDPASPIDPNEPLDLRVCAKTVNSARFMCNCGVAFSCQKTLKGHQKFYCKSIIGSIDISPNNAVAVVNDEQLNDNNSAGAQTPKSLRQANNNSTERPQSVTSNGGQPQPHRVSSKRSAKQTIPSANSVQCAQCDFTAPHRLALTQHERVVHGCAHAFVCALCGYKGYSVRGMKSHIRTHENIDKHNIDEALLQHVYTETGTTKPPSIKQRTTTAAAGGTSSPAILCPLCRVTFVDAIAYSAHPCLLHVLNVKAGLSTSTIGSDEQQPPTSPSDDHSDRSSTNAVAAMQSNKIVLNGN